MSSISREKKLHVTKIFDRFVLFLFWTELPEKSGHICLKNLPFFWLFFMITALSTGRYFVGTIENIESRSSVCTDKCNQMSRQSF